MEALSIRRQLWYFQLSPLLKILPPEWDIESRKESNYWLQIEKQITSDINMLFSQCNNESFIEAFYIFWQETILLN